MLNASTVPKQLDVFPDRIYLRRSDPQKNMNQFYMMLVQPDLFGGASLIREWGRIGRAGRVAVTRHQDQAQALNQLGDYATKKKKRGYAPI